MRRRTACLLLGAAAAARGQLREIEVDASRAAGEIRPVFGLNAPEDERQAAALLAAPLDAPVRLGPRVPRRAELAEALPLAWLDDEGGSLAVWEAGAVLEPLAEAAHAVAAAIALLDEGLREAYFTPRGGRLFDDRGEAVPAAVAMGWASSLLETPRRVDVRAADGLAIAAGVSADGETVRVVVANRLRANDEEGPEGFVLWVRGLPWGAQEFSVERRRMSDASDAVEIRTGAGRGGEARIVSRLPASGVEWIELRRLDGPPSPVAPRRRTR